MPTDRVTIRFGPFVLDLAGEQLRRDGVVVPLAPQPFKALRLLAGRPLALVTRDELRRALWGDDQFVDFNAGLNFCIAQLRTALGDQAGSPEYIETVPRRGYRFIAPVERAVPAVPAPVTTGGTDDPADARPVSRVARFDVAAVLAIVVVLGALAAITMTTPAGRRTDVGSASLEAIGLVERATLDLVNASPEELRTRAALLQSAIELDPAFARAYAALAETYLMMGEYRAMPPQAAYAVAKASAARAMAIDNRSSGAHAAYAAAVLLLEWDWAAAQRHFGVALRDPTPSAPTLYWYSGYLSASGRTREAVAYATRGTQVSRPSARAFTSLGRASYYAGDYPAALEACERAIALEPRHTPAKMCAMLAAADAHLPARALPYAAELMPAADGALPEESSRRIVQADPPGFWRLRAARLRQSDCDANALSLASALARTGDSEEAFRWLSRAAELHADGLVFAAVEPGFKALHGDPRFRAVLERVGLPGRSFAAAR